METAASTVPPSVARRLVAHSLQLSLPLPLSNSVQRKLLKAGHSPRRSLLTIYPEADT
jgi:hypothetical protein